MRGLNSPIISFYRGDGHDHAGRSLREILTWSDDRLERHHDFIQWLFPLPEPSPFNPEAPILDRATIDAFASDPALRENLRASLVRMMAFYGLEFGSEPTLAVKRASTFARQSANWLTPGNHNHLRITRILKSATLLGLADEAQALFRCLKDIYRESRPAISDRSFAFWRNAVGGQ